MSCYRCLLISSIVIVSTVNGATAAPPLDQLLPNTTCAVAIAPNAADLIRAWEHTQFSAFVTDPHLGPFLDDVEQQWRKGQILFGQLRLDWADLKAAASGPAAIAILRPQAERVALAALIDTTGKEDKRNMLLAKLARNLIRAKGRSKEEVIQQHGVTAMSIPTADGSRTVPLFLLPKDNLLLLTSDAAAMDAILSRWDRAKESLAEVKEFQIVRDRTRPKNGEAPHLIWFIDPGSYASAIRLLNPRTKTQSKKDALTILGEEGLSSVKGVGGAIWLDAGPFDMISRVAVVAPKPFQRAMQMLDFPNRRTSDPPSWVPADVTRCVTFSWDTAGFLTGFGFVFDRIAGKTGDFAEVIKSLRDDPEGPHVDLQREVLGRFTGQVTLISDCPADVPDRGDRTLIAFRVREEKALAESISRLLDGEEGVSFNRYLDQPFWEISAKTKLKNGTMVQRPKMALAVSDGLLLFANDVSLFQKVIRHKADNGKQSLTQHPHFRIANDELNKLIPEQVSFRLFARSAEDIRGTYVLTQTNRLDRAETLASLLLRGWLEDTKITLDTMKIPPFEKVGHHLQPYGAAAITRPDGWDIVGIALKKAPAPAKP